jgi:hypothetical protein
MKLHTAFNMKDFEAMFALTQISAHLCGAPRNIFAQEPALLGNIEGRFGILPILCNVTTETAWRFEYVGSAVLSEVRWGNALPSCKQGPCDLSVFGVDGTWRQKQTKPTNEGENSLVQNGEWRVAVAPGGRGWS